MSLCTQGSEQVNLLLMTCPHACRDLCRDPRFTGITQLVQENDPAQPGLNPDTVPAKHCQAALPPTSPPSVWTGGWVKEWAGVGVGECWNGGLGGGVEGRRYVPACLFLSASLPARLSIIRLSVCLSVCLPICVHPAILTDCLSLLSLCGLLCS